jgi:hypothetical protein
MDNVQFNLGEREWHFDTPPNTAVLVLKHVLNKEKPILYVYRSSEDGMWQFLDGDVPREEDILVVSLQHVLNSDPSLYALSDLDQGWEAFRENSSSSWVRRYNG